MVGRSATTGRVGSGRALLERWLAPRAQADPRWIVHDVHAMTAVDHSPWAAFLERYRQVDALGVARLKYGDITADDRDQITQYIRGLQREPVGQLSRTEQLAYWVNLYNAAMVQLVLRHYPVRSVKAIGPRLSTGPWAMDVVVVDGQPLSLAHIENRIVRPIWQDPRVHYVLNCASVGCPNLPRQPLTGTNCESMMRAAQAAYLGSQRGARVEAGKVFVSSLFNWFSTDFGGDMGVIELLREHGTPSVVEALRNNARIAGFFYDWRLNAP